MALTNKNRHFSTYEDALDDLLFRFVNFIEEDEVNDLVRVMFHIEQAWWTYVEHTLPSNPHLKSKPFHTFTVDIINHSPFLQHFKDQSHNALEVFREYKKNIPTCGTIIVDSSLEYCLVLSMYSSSKNFGFPKGKINQNEELVDCAIRETYEETGFDCSSHIQKNIFFDAKINQSSCRLYLVTGIPLDFKFKPKARHEIKKIQWLLINALPNNKDDFENAALCDGKPGNFFLILPFVKQLKNVIRKLRNPHADGNNFSNNSNSSMTMRRSVEIRPSRSSAFKPVKRDISQENVEYKKVYSKSECGTPKKANNISSSSTGKSNDKGESNFYQNQLLNNLLTEDEKTGADFYRNYGYDNTTVTPITKNNDRKKIDSKKKKNDSSQVCNNTLIKEGKKEVNNQLTNVQNNTNKKNLEKTTIKTPKKSKSLSGRKTKDLSPPKSQISSNLLREFQETAESNKKIGNTNSMNKKKNNEIKLSSNNKDGMPSSKEQQLTTGIIPQYSGIDFIKIFYNTQGSK